MRGVTWVVVEEVQSGDWASLGRSQDPRREDAGGRGSGGQQRLIVADVPVTPGALLGSAPLPHDRHLPAPVRRSRQDRVVELERHLQEAREGAAIIPVARLMWTRTVDRTLDVTEAPKWASDTCTFQSERPNSDKRPGPTGPHGAPSDEWTVSPPQAPAQAESDLEATPPDR